MEQQIRAIEQKIAELLEEDPAYFLVEVRINAGNNVKVFIDGDKGVSINELVKYNRHLYRYIDETGLFPNGIFSLEVSSPGLDEPLKLHRQYLKNIGRDVEVMQKDGIKKEGRLVSANNTEIIVEDKLLLPSRTGMRKNFDDQPRNQVKNLPGQQTVNKKELVQHTILIENIKIIKIQVKF